MSEQGNSMIEWSNVVGGLRPGDLLHPLVGGSKLTVESVDEEQICIRQRLWRACVTRRDFRTATAILEQSPREITPLELAERIRVHFMSGHDVATECTRVPNLTAVILFNLGAVQER